MAANLALQYAAGVQAPACQQLRRNLVTKAQKTSIRAVADNSPAAIQYCKEGSSFGSISRHLHTYSSVSTQRNKTMVVSAYPDVKVIPGIPEYTKGELENHSGVSLTLDDKIFWEGSRPEKIDKEIKNGETSYFTQKADRGSIGALEYVLPGDKYKWIIAWSNARNDLNKVYTAILQEEADWTEIKDRLEASGQESIFHEYGIPYSSKVVIDKMSPTPTMVAKLQMRLENTSEDANISEDFTQDNGTAATPPQPAGTPVPTPA